VSVKVSQLLKCVRLPKNDMALLSATGDLFVLYGVDETVDSLLMQVESFLLLIVQCVQLMHVDESIERRREKHV